MPFRRVEPQHAGANALGILVPPGEKTLVIMRPRGLSWDLLPARWDGAADRPPLFCSFGRDEAAGVARKLMSDLEAQLGRFSPVQTVSDAAETRFQVWVQTAAFVWIVCARTPGKAYAPLVFNTQAEAAVAGNAIERVVWPASDVEQEYYFNTQRFV